jgi:prepilin-type N-terminal cleavage/methylation domain-containing protein
MGHARCAQSHFWKKLPTRETKVQKQPDFLPEQPQSNMNLGRTGQRYTQARKRGFTLVETLMSVAVLAIMFVALYGGLSFGISQIQLSREDERATQILCEKMEVVRLLSWDQLVNLPGYVPSSFSASYSVANPTNAPAGSLIYSGTVVVTNAPVSEPYGTDLRMIQISLTWQSGNRTQTRTMTTFASRYGLQNYVY